MTDERLYMLSRRCLVLLMMMMMINCFCGMADQQTAITLISSWDLSAILTIANLQHSRIEPVQYLSSTLSNEVVGYLWLYLNNLCTNAKIISKFRNTR